MREKREVDPLGLNLPAGHRLPRTLAPADRQVGGRPLHAVAEGEGQTLRGELTPVVIARSLQSTRQRTQDQRLGTRAQWQSHVSRRDVDRCRDSCTVGHVDPCPKRACALLQRHRQIDVLPQLADVSVGKVHMDLAAPALPIGGLRHQWLGESRHGGETITPACWRSRVNAQVVVAQRIANDDLYVGQRQSACGVQRVGPAQRAATNDKFLQIEEPVRHAAVAAIGAAEVDPGDVDPAARIAHDVEFGIVDQQLREPRLERQKRTRRQRDHDARQSECGLRLCVVNGHVAQLESRHPAARSHDDFAHLHPLAKNRAGPALDGLSPPIDVRQNEPVQCQPRQDHQTPCREDGPSKPTQPAQKPADQPIVDSDAGRGRVGGDDGFGTGHGVCGIRGAACRRTVILAATRLGSRPVRRAHLGRAQWANTGPESIQH